MINKPSLKKTIKAMHLKNLILFILITVTVFAGCSSSKKVTGVWVNKEKQRTEPYASLFIVALTGDPEARVAVENNVANVAAARGIRVVKSIDVINIDLKNPRLVTREEVTSKVKENNCEGIFVTSLLDKDESVRFTPGSTSYRPSTYYTWAGYYTNVQTAVAKPGYYTNSKTYFIETNMYDAKTEEVMWAAQSTIFSPSSIKSFCQSYVSTLMEQLKNEGVIKK
jgi:hypothetical protein